MSHQKGKTEGQRVVRQTSVGRTEAFRRRRRVFHALREWLCIGMVCGWVLSSSARAAAIPRVPMCSSNLTIECSGNMGVEVNFSSGTGSPATRCEPGSGSVFLPGTTVVRCTAWNIYGETNTCKFFVTVVDTNQPSLACPETVMVPTDPGGCYATGVALGLPTTSYFGGLVSITNDAPGAFPKGTNLVTWIASDAQSNRAAGQQLVIVLDQQPPVMDIRPVVTMPAPEGRSSVLGSTLEPPSVTDNCEGVKWTNDAPTELAVGTHWVRWTATDVDGNSASDVQQMVVIDTQAPSLEFPPDIVLPAEAGQAFATDVELVAPVVSDNHAVAYVTNDVRALYGAGRDWWWVDPAAGNDADALRGDYRRAFRTLGAALTNVQDGDTIIMMPGTNLIRCAFLGDETPELLVTRSNLSIYGQPGATLVATNLGDGILCVGAANLKIKGLTLRGFRTSDDAVPFRLWAGIHMMGGCEGTEIAGNQLDNWMNQGIAVLNGDPGTSTNVWVHDNFITRCGFVWRTANGFPLNRFDGAAIVPDAGWLVESNRIEDCAVTIEVYPPDNLGYRGQPCVVRNNFLKNNLTGICGGNNLCPVIITGNTVINATNYAWVVDTNFNAWLGLWHLEGWFPYGVAFQGHCDGPVVSSNTLSGWRIGILAIDGALTNAVFTGNFISETRQAGILLGDANLRSALSRNLVIRGNSFTNATSCWSGYGAISVYCAADTEISGNSISGEYSEGVGVYSSSSVVSSNVTVRDNLLDGVFDWGVVVSEGTQAASINHTLAGTASFRWGKYHTNEAEVLVTEGPPEGVPPTLPARVELSDPWISTSWETGLDSEVPTLFPLGTNLVLWTAADLSGNTTTCAQQIIVLETAPGTGPEDLTVAVQSNCAAVVHYPLPGAAANVVVTCDPPPGSAFPVGSTTVRCWTSDGTGYAKPSSFWITLNEEPPAIIIGLDNDRNSFVLSWSQTCGEWVLETNSTCADPAGWSPLSITPEEENGVHRVVLPFGGEQRYFRLRQP